MTTSEQPYRLVDAHNQGWLITSGGGYQPDYGHRRGLDNMTLEQITEQRGPWRPVEPITDEDEATLRYVFLGLGRKTIATLAAALDVVYYELRESKGGLRNFESAEYAERTLKAGREGSWESELLMEIVWFGNGLNLAKSQRGHDNSIEERRRRGPSTRVDKGGRDRLAALIRDWVTNSDRYTEVAETLAFRVAHYADEAAYGDELADRGVRLADDPDSMAGWKTVADQWLQPGGMANEEFVRCYRLFYSTSAHFNTDLI